MAIIVLTLAPWVSHETQHNDSQHNNKNCNYQHNIRWCVLVCWISLNWESICWVLYMMCSNNHMLSIIILRGIMLSLDFAEFGLWCVQLSKFFWVSLCWEACWVLSVLCSKVIMLSIIMLRGTTLTAVYALLKAHYAERHNAEQCLCCVQSPLCWVSLCWMSQCPLLAAWQELGVSIFKVTVVGILANATLPM